MNSTSELVELLNDLCLSAVMLDASSIKEEAPVLQQSIQHIRKLVAQDSLWAPISGLLEALDASLTSGLYDRVLDLLKLNASSFQQVIEGKTNVFVLIDPAQQEASPSEVSPDADPELIIEFIEKHTSLLDELEAAVTEFQFASESERSAETLESFRRFVKGYVHSVKGDAGSVGINGIERGCHYLEDHFTLYPIETLCEEILLFKEWVAASMVALSQHEQWPTSSTVFAASLKQRHAVDSTTKPTEPAPSNEFPDANLDLLAELLGEASGPSAAPSPGNEHPNANLDLLAELLGETPPAVESKPSTPKPAAPTPSAPDAQKTEVRSGMTYQLEGEAELYSEFAVESADHLGQMESAILDAEGVFTGPTIDLIFRAIHSIKGASAYFKLAELTETSHLTENLLDQCRKGERAFDQPLCALALEYVDLARSVLAKGGAAWNNGGTVTRESAADEYITRLKAYERGETAPKPSAGATPVNPLMVNTSASTSAPAVTSKPAAAAEPQENKGEKLDIKNFVKVDTARLDQLIDSIGEMCIYSTMLNEKCRKLLHDHPDVIHTTHQVEKFAKELQNIGMSMRLIPIRGLFQKMSRLVWDTSKKINKDIKFVMHGEDTELDRSIIDKLADPLMHMVRNSLDHGVENPADRIAAGKPGQGNVELSAFHSGGSIHIRIKDDGRGLDPEKLIKKAIEKGVIADGARLSDAEAFQLIFAAGFSTAAQVTDLSGRGVGMDVVRRNIESMRGRIIIESTVNVGTTFTIELPLTLAIIDGIQVSLGSELYIIPTLSVVELLRPLPELITETLDRGETYQFRGRYLPVYRLGDLFHRTPRYTRPEEALFVVVETNGEQFVIMVDDVVGSYSTVIKSLGDMFQEQKGLAGCCVLATGDVALILDVRSVLDLARSNYRHQKREPSHPIHLSEAEVIH